MREPELEMLDPFFRDTIIFASLLSLMSIGITLAYLTTRVANFAHASFVIYGAYVSITFFKVLNLNLYLSLPVAFGIGSILSLFMYKAILGPLGKRGASTLMLLVAAFAFDIILFGGINIYADYLTTTYRIQSRNLLLTSADFSLGGLPGVFYVSILLTTTTFTVLHVFLTRTRFGIAMRAALGNRFLSSAVGINTELVNTVAWILAGGLAGISGALLPLHVLTNPTTATLLVISMFAASITGGLTNIYGALLGGMVVGAAEIIGTRGLALVTGTWVLSYEPVVPLAFMVLVLMLAPRGLLELNWGSFREKIKLRIKRR